MIKSIRPVYLKLQRMKFVNNWILKLTLLAVPFTLFEISHAQQAAVNLGSAYSATSLNDPYQSKLFRVRGAPKIMVNTISGDISVIQNSQINGVQVDLYVERGFSLWAGTRSLDNYRIIMQQHGNQIIASVEDRRRGSPRRGGDVQFHFVVQIPAEASTELRTINGSIDLEGADGKHFLQNQEGNLSVKHARGEIRVVSTTGNIDLEKLEGNVFAKTLNGDIRINDNSGEVRVRSIAGNIYVEKMSGTLIAATTSGNINTDFTHVSKGIYLETVSGDIQLSIPSAEGYDIQGKAMRFDLAGIHPSSISEQSQNFRERTIVIRDGGLPVQLSTVSGLIRVSEN